MTLHQNAKTCPLATMVTRPRALVGIGFVADCGGLGSSLTAAGGRQRPLDQGCAAFRDLGRRSIGYAHTVGAPRGPFTVFGVLGLLMD
jgi:hypothetical protein